MDKKLNIYLKYIYIYKRNNGGKSTAETAETDV